MLWTRHGDHGLQWYNAMVSIATNRNHRIVMEIEAGLNYDSYVAIDDVIILEEPCGECYSYIELISLKSQIT